MSAFVVSDDHISLLVTAAMDDRHFSSSYFSTLPGAPKGDDPDDADALGKALLRENTRSVLFRYQGDDLEGMEAIERYTFRRIHPTFVTPVIVLKACDCYDYQACETNDYHERWAAKWVQQLRKSMISKLPGYDDAPWGFDEPEGTPQVVSLTDLMRRKRG